MSLFQAKQPIPSAKPVKEDDLESWANDEVAPLLRQVHERLQLSTSAIIEVDTAGDGATTELFLSEEFPPEGIFDVELDVVAYPVTPSSDGTSTGVAAHFSLLHTVETHAEGALQTVGAPIVRSRITSSSAMTVTTALTSARKFQVNVTDDGATPMRFVANIVVAQLSTL